MTFAKAAGSLFVKPEPSFVQELYILSAYWSIGGVGDNVPINGGNFDKLAGCILVIAISSSKVPVNHTRPCKNRKSKARAWGRNIGVVEDEGVDIEIPKALQGIECGVTLYSLDERIVLILCLFDSILCSEGSTFTCSSMEKPIISAIVSGKLKVNGSSSS